MIAYRMPQENRMQQGERSDISLKLQQEGHEVGF